MKRLAVGACAVALCTLPGMGPTPAASPEARGLPMHFDLRVEGPADVCRDACRTWISATGAITADTPRDFEAFVKGRNVKGATVALDSDGGSVLGALALGRTLRRLGVNTTVGRTVDLASADGADNRARLNPRAYCESMCAFVLLGGVVRQVPAEARVMVHQIWLGDRREDPTAANYSAEDLVLVQRDIGRLAQYTIEMGGGIDLLEIALKIPPWEPMRLLSRDELRGMKIVTGEAGPTVASAAPVAKSVAPSGGSRVAGNERTWMMVEKAGQTVLARKHPLTVEGDDIGSFELTIGCGEPGKDYTVTYVEQRRATGAGRSPEALTEIELSLSGKAVPMNIVSSKANNRPLEIVSVANGTLSAEVLQPFADPRSRSLTIETTSEDLATAIRIGNAGLARNFAQLAASCGQQKMVRAPALRREAEAQPR